MRSFIMSSIDMTLGVGCRVGGSGAKLSASSEVGRDDEPNGKMPLYKDNSHPKSVLSRRVR